jgi:hypothetical protein
LNAIATRSSIKGLNRNVSGFHQGSEFTQIADRSAIFGNPAICHSQTGSFAPPSCEGFAFVERE